MIMINHSLINVKSTLIVFLDIKLFAIMMINLVNQWKVIELKKQV